MGKEKMLFTSILSFFHDVFETVYYTDVLKLWIIIQSFKGGYLDFSTLTELKNICMNEIYLKKQYKSSITKCHKIWKKKKKMMEYP